MRSIRSSALLLLTVAAACADGPTDLSPVIAPSASAVTASPSSFLTQINKRLAGARASHRVFKAEYLTDARDGNQAGQTVYANDRHWRLDANWVPADPERGGRTNLTYVVDQSRGSALSWAGAPPAGPVVTLSNSVTEAAIDRAFDSWDEGTDCSALPIDKVAYRGGNIHVVDDIIAGLAPKRWGTPVADVTEAGWMPASFFDAIATDGSDFILGVTFTLIWVDDVTGEPTDQDGDGRNDVAFREIYYNRSFPWSTDLTPYNIDIESVVLHENGHALDLDHFGMISEKPDGRLQFSPFAVMNAAYVFPQQQLTGTDVGHHCAQFDSWPN